MQKCLIALTLYTWNVGSFVVKSYFDNTHPFIVVAGAAEELRLLGTLPDAVVRIPFTALLTAVLTQGWCLVYPSCICTRTALNAALLAHRPQKKEAAASG